MGQRVEDASYARGQTMATVWFTLPAITCPHLVIPGFIGTFDFIHNRLVDTPASFNEYIPELANAHMRYSPVRSISEGPSNLGNPSPQGLLTADPRLGNITSGATSNYNSLQVQIHRPFAEGLKISGGWFA